MNYNTRILTDRPNNIQCSNHVIEPADDILFNFQTGGYKK